MSRGRILFVDDNIFCNMETCDVLRDFRFNIVSVYCSAAAIEVINKHERLCGLVTDIELGPGVDGFEVARQFRAAYPEPPVVFISGAAWSRYATERVAGSQFIAKPFDPHEIVEALDLAIYNEAA